MFRTSLELGVTGNVLVKTKSPQWDRRMTPQISEFFGIDPKQRIDFYLSQFELDNLGSDCVLDVGCGNGLLLSRLGERAKACVGFDIKPRAAWSCVPDNVTFLVSDFNHSFPFRDETFDVVFMVSVLEQFRRPWHTFQETARVLKPGGRLYLQAPNRYCPVELSTLLPFWGYLPGERLKNAYVNMFRPERNRAFSYSHQDRFLDECRRNMVMEMSSSYIYPKELIPSHWHKSYSLYDTLTRFVPFIAMGKILVFKKL
jgi:SAM-dependent methyltransferase